MQYRRLNSADISRILDLQEANLLDPIDEMQRQTGFLSVRFTSEQFFAIAEDLAVIVAHDGKNVQGYLCASTPAFNKQVPLLECILKRTESLHYLEQPLAQQRFFVYGPVCVDYSQRGRGLLREMYECLKSELIDEYEIGITFISKNNPHSLQVHIALGYQLIDNFVHGSQKYWILATKLERFLSLNRLHDI